MTREAGHSAIEPVIIPFPKLVRVSHPLYHLLIEIEIEMGLYTYLRVHAETTVETESGGDHRRIGDELTFRKTIQDALARAFGVSGAGTYVDVLRFRSRTINTTDAHAKEGGRTIEDAVIRVARESQSIRMRGMLSLVTYDVPQVARDTPRIKAALASSPAPVRLSVVDESTFLPALLASEFSPLR
ncbi:hypothetical protein A7U60_g7034 [Sanghuangporus baumii]|uniref:Uncharacterized protein n=1 Tax=Sanghuangporus baumii TaxID=108892 RepID=A0A9Q5HTV2_SANBA|nr:hypothetical protein A7U60_g7034 [Sanghuangporus baumii]